MPNDFDMACRRMVKARPAAFLHWLIRDFADTARQTGWVDTRRISFPGRPDWKSSQRRSEQALLPWIPLHRGGSSATVIERCLELANAETDETSRGNFAYDTLVFAEKSDDPEAWRKALEGWNMIRSETMEKTRREGMQQLLLRALSTRTSQSVPEDIANRFRACEDASRLYE